MTLPLHQVLVIPQKATYELQDKTYVYVVDAQNSVHTRNITVRQRMTNLFVIEAGLAENDKLLLEGIQLVKENDVIEPVPVEPATVMAQLIKR